MSTLEKHFTPDCKTCDDFIAVTRCRYCSEMNMYYPDRRTVITKIDNLEEELADSSYIAYTLGVKHAGDKYEKEIEDLKKQLCKHNCMENYEEG